MRRAVLTALDVLGLERPSGLRPRSSGLVGLIMPGLENPVYPLCAQVVQTNLARQGYTPVLCIQSADGTSEEEYVGMLLDRGVSGIIFVSGRHADTALDPAPYRALVAQRLPIVLVNGFADGVAAPFVSSDDFSAGGLAATHLADLGHERIGMLSSSLTNIGARRQVDGYRSVVRQRLGMRGDELTDVSFPGEAGGYAGAARLLDKGVTAIVCGSDLMALGAIRAVRQRGRRVPEDVSVVGYDDSALMAYTDPPLTTVRQPMLTMGMVAARTLIDSIRGLPGTPAESLFPPELVIRGSTAAHRR